MFTRKKLLAFSLILIIVLLSGCSSNRYPKDMAAMTKLFDENTEEFQKFADNILLQLEAEEAIHILFMPEKAKNGYSYSYTIDDGSGRNWSSQEPISKLKNGKEISGFISKYGVFKVRAKGSEKASVFFDLFPMELATKMGQGSGYKPENLKDVRYYYYQPNETDEKIAELRTRNTELAEHWYAYIRDK